MPKVTVRREAHFNAAHRLHNPFWSEEKNSEVFGKCNNPRYHGHNYKLIVEVTGHIDTDTGYVVDMKWLKDVIKDSVESKLDHKNLNEEVREFQELNPTAENIAVVIWNWLRQELPEYLDLSILLYETERNSVRYGGD